MDTEHVHPVEALLQGVEREAAACRRAIREEVTQDVERHAHALLALAATVVDLVESS